LSSFFTTFFPALSGFYFSIKVKTNKSNNSHPVSGSFLWCFDIRLTCMNISSHEEKNSLESVPVLIHRTIHRHWGKRDCTAGELFIGMIVSSRPQQRGFSSQEDAFGSG